MRRPPNLAQHPLVGGPTIIAMHHPPFKTGIRAADADPLGGADAFADIVRKHPQVERIICGHFHRPIQARVGGAVASSSPSTAMQAALNLEEDLPLMFTMEPPACELHLWWPESGVVSHISYIDQFDGPYRFSDGSRVSID